MSADVSAAVLSDRAERLKPFRFKPGQTGNPGGRKPKGLAEMRRTFREAFAKEPRDGGRSLTIMAIQRARGEDIMDLVKAMVDAAERGGEHDDKIIRSLGSVLNVSRAVSQTATEFCKRVGFGADPKQLDDETVYRLAQQIVAQGIAEARARLAAREQDKSTAPPIDVEAKP